MCGPPKAQMSSSSVILTWYSNVKNDALIRVTNQSLKIYFPFKSVHKTACLGLRYQVHPGLICSSLKEVKFVQTREADFS